MRQVAIIATTAIAFLQASVGQALEPPVDADTWLTNAAPLPPPYEKIITATNSFMALKAEAVAKKLWVTWSADAKYAEVRIVASAGASGHWPARDWRTYAMRRSGAGWVVEVPVDSLSEPLIYFLVAREKERMVASPMRMAWPEALGLEEPTRIFWPFIEGFEQGLEGWRVLGESGLRTDGPPKNGRAALAIVVPEGRRSVTVVTTRLRGWFLEEHGATGVTLWLRTKRGTGAAAFTLFGNAASTNQIIARRAATVAITENWTKADLSFRSFPALPLDAIDLFAIELIARPGTEFLLDDVQLLGRWTTDL